MNILTREHVNRRLLVIVAIITAALLAIGIWLTFSLLRPTPPRSVAMAIDPEGSFSAELGKRYRELLARDGIDLRLVPTAGAVESMARLRDPKSGVSISIIPGGISNQQVARLFEFYKPLTREEEREIWYRQKGSESISPIVTLPDDERVEDAGVVGDPGGRLGGDVEGESRRRDAECDRGGGEAFEHVRFRSPVREPARAGFRRG